MASDQDDPVFPEEDLEDDDDDSQSPDEDDLDHLENNDNEEEEEDEEDDLNFPSIPFPAAVKPPTTTPPPPSTINNSVPAVTLAIPVSSVGTYAASGGGSNNYPSVIVDHSGSDPKQQHIDVKKSLPIPQMDDSRRLFQRLWTDDDEIEVLQGFLDYTTQRGGSAHHHDTTMFYDQIKSKIQLDFNKNQLMEKLRRLKKKYRTVVSKRTLGKDFAFKSPHDQATFDISRKIWGKDYAALDDDEPNPSRNLNMSESEGKMEDFGYNKKAVVVGTPSSSSRKRPRTQSSALKVEEKSEFISSNCVGTINNLNNNANTLEETVKNCLGPMMKEAVAVAAATAGRGIGGLSMNAMPLMYGGKIWNSGDERWRKLQIMELEVYSKRLELVQDEIKAALVELRSAGGGGGGNS